MKLGLTRRVCQTLSSQPSEMNMIPNVGKEGLKKVSTLDFKLVILSFR